MDGIPDMDEIPNMAEVAIVEDDPDDILYTKILARRNRLYFNFSIFFDGRTFLDYLESGIKSERFRKPDLVLLDLNMPDIDGREVLKFIKSNPSLRDISIVIVSSLCSEHEILEMENLGAAKYLTKPLKLHALTSIPEKVRNVRFLQRSSANYLIKVA